MLWAVWTISIYCRAASFFASSLLEGRVLSIKAREAKNCPVLRTFLDSLLFFARLSVDLFQKSQKSKAVAAEDNIASLCFAGPSK